MGRIPDSPEGVALALAFLILGVDESLTTRQPLDEEEVLRVFRRCLAATRPYDVSDSASMEQDAKKVGCH